MKFNEMRRKMGKIYITSDFMESEGVSDFFEFMRKDGAIGISLEHDIATGLYTWFFISPHNETVYEGCEIPYYQLHAEEKLTMVYKLV
jgi:hypothetical protein